MTLIFDLLTSKSNQVIYVSNCTKVENLVKFQQAVCKILCNKISAYDHTWTETRTARKQNAFGS